MVWTTAPGGQAQAQAQAQAARAEEMEVILQLEGRHHKEDRVLGGEAR